MARVRGPVRIQVIPRWSSPDVDYRRDTFTTVRVRPRWILSSTVVEFTDWVLTQQINMDNYSNVVSVSFWAWLSTSSAAKSARARLYNITDAVVVAGSEIATLATTPTRISSGPITLPAGVKEYKVQFGGAQKGGLNTYKLHKAEVVIVQAA